MMAIVIFLYRSIMAKAHPKSGLHPDWFEMVHIGWWVSVIPWMALLMVCRPKHFTECLARNGKTWFLIIYA